MKEDEDKKKNPIERLDEAVGKLEDQADRVTEFNGILAAVDKARSAIESSNKLLENASARYQQLIAGHEGTLEELRKRLDSFEQKIDDANRAHRSLLKTLKIIIFIGIIALAYGTAYINGYVNLGEQSSSASSTKSTSGARVDGSVGQVSKGGNDGSQSMVVPPPESPPIPNIN